MVYKFAEIFDELFPEHVEKYESYKDHPLYIALNAVHQQFIKELIYDTDGNAPKDLPEAVKAQVKVEEVECQHAGDEDELMKKREKSCDQIFAEYLGSIARKVCNEYYIKVLRFVFLFRECVNDNGEKLIEERKNLPAFLFPKNNVTYNPTKDYCCDNNAEQVPDMCNEFLLNYLERRENQVEMTRTELIELTQNMCYWMFINGYTCSKIALIE